MRLGVEAGGCICGIIFERLGAVNGRSKRGGVVGRRSCVA